MQVQMGLLRPYGVADRRPRRVHSTHTRASVAVLWLAANSRQAAAHDLRDYFQCPLSHRLPVALVVDPVWLVVLLGLFTLLQTHDRRALGHRHLW